MGLLSIVAASAAVASGAPAAAMTAPPAQPLTYSELKAVDARMNGRDHRVPNHRRRAGAPPRLRPTLPLPARVTPSPEPQ